MKIKSKIFLVCYCGYEINYRTLSSTKRNNMNLFLTMLLTLTPLKTVQSKGTTIHISPVQAIALQSLNNTHINAALSLKTIKSNDTADLIIKLLK